MMAITKQNNNKVTSLLGIVVTTSPTCNLYRMVVFPAPSKPKISILISREPNKFLKYDISPPTHENIYRVTNLFVK